MGIDNHICRHVIKELCEDLNTVAKTRVQVQMAQIDISLSLNKLDLNSLQVNNIGGGTKNWKQGPLGEGKDLSFISKIPFEQL